MAVKKREKPHFESLNELLGAPDVVDGQTEIRIDMIDPFKNHPFKVLDNDDMEELVESIKQNGVLVPVTVRTNPDDESRYEMISGHRRMHAATLAGLKTIPAIIKEMSDDEATIAMVDSNMQRDEILPSEKAYSIKMKMDYKPFKVKIEDKPKTKKEPFVIPFMGRTTNQTSYPNWGAMVPTPDNGDNKMPDIHVPLRGQSV